MLDIMIKINGIYDIACGLSILKILPESPLSHSHINIFKRHHIYYFERFERCLSFYIMLYGFMRIFGSNSIISFSYLSEALYYFNEMVYHNSVYTDKATYVIIKSTMLSMLCWLC